MTPAARLVDLLADARRSGQEFDAAWPCCVAEAVGGAAPRERDDWRVALDETAPAWAAAYARRPATRAQRALLAVAADPDRVALPAHGACARCDAPLPSPRHGQARKWCSDRCRREASRRVPLAA
jgi:hypothetical protein